MNTENFLNKKRNILKTSRNVSNVVNNDEDRDVNEFKSNKIKNISRDDNSTKLNKYINNNNTFEQIDENESQYDQNPKVVSHITPEQEISLNIVKQQETYYSLIGTRIILQDILKSSNSLPYTSHAPFFNNQSLNQVKLLNSLTKTNNLQSKLLSKLIIKINKPILNANGKAESSISKPFNPSNWLIKFCNKILDSNYRETVSKLNSSSISFTSNILDGLDTYHSNYLKRPVKDEVMGLTMLGLSEATVGSTQIYKDDDFYDLLLKEFINYSGGAGGGDATGEEDEAMLHQQTLMRIKSRGDRKSKISSSKMSKNKKINYQKHEKIVNFMLPEDNYLLFKGRDELINRLFGVEWKETETKDKLKSKKKSFNDGIKII